jgi:biopolymer transport protein ExbD
MTLFLGACLLALTTPAQPALRPGVSVQLVPTTSAAPLPDADRADASIVAVAANGTIYFGIIPMSPKDLAGRVKAELAAYPGKRLYVKADAHTPFSDVGSTLDALRAAGVDAPFLLTDQRNAGDTPPVPPKGLEVRLAAPPAGSRVVDARRLPRACPKRVAVKAEPATPFADVVRAIDHCHAKGATVFLLTPRR